MREWCKRHAGKLAIALAVLAVVLGVAVTVQATMLHAQGWRMAWGTLPDWLGAVGPLATVLALVVAWRVYRHDVDARQEDLNARREADRRQYTELVSVWLINRAGVRLLPPKGDANPTVVNWVDVGLLNASQVVMYDLVVVVLTEHTTPVPVPLAGGGYAQAPETPWEPRRDRVARGRPHVLPPGRWTGQVRLATVSVMATDIHLFFRDNRGVYWWRKSTGDLVEQPPPPANDEDGLGRWEQILDALGEEPPRRGASAFVLKPLGDTGAS